MNAIAVAAGSRFGHLVVASMSRRAAICSCDCGGHRIVRLTDLRRGRITRCSSCGYGSYTKGRRLLSRIESPSVPSVCPRRAGNSGEACQYICRYRLPGLAGTTCALDAAEAGRATLDEVAAAFGVSRERVRQIEEKAAAKVTLEMCRVYEEAFEATEEDA